ncbi:hypothetical protein OPV22_022555 [Ensete ventricosum]|uniref:HTH myb-type domain-containing protein n=1 Tax=Ensete ventricosum TaxID=4639 RepID=A0AAV8QUT3_ENSVE|nr:hypothetical protein OPV22_022555 [Ensete ventricosum]
MVVSTSRCLGLKLLRTRVKGSALDLSHTAPLFYGFCVRFLTSRRLGCSPYHRVRVCGDGECAANGSSGGHKEGAVDGAGGSSTGLNRTGKSCRLRWVNYLHPGLKRGRMTPQEEHLVLELHAKWGNRWSRIARRLPGRTDNEIKNYWRTHMRKKAQERRTSSAPSPSSSSSSNISELRTEKHEGCSTAEGTSLISGLEVNDNEGKGYTMDQIWNEIAASESVSKLSFDEYKGGSACNMESPPVSSPIWEDCSASLWRMEDEDLCPMTDLLLSNR